MRRPAVSSGCHPLLLEQQVVDLQFGFVHQLVQVPPQDPPGHELELRTEVGKQLPGVGVFTKAEGGKCLHKPPVNEN